MISGGRALKESQEERPWEARTRRILLPCALKVTEGSRHNTKGSKRKESVTKLNSRRDEDAAQPSMDWRKKKSGAGVDASTSKKQSGLHRQTGSPDGQIEDKTASTLQTNAGNYAKKTEKTHAAGQK